MARVASKDKVAKVPANIVDQFRDWSEFLCKLGFEPVSFDFSEHSGVVGVQCQKNGNGQFITPELREILEQR